MAIPAVDKKLQKFRVTDLNSLLWFFTLSRDEIIRTTKNSITNTDLNIYSETHLSSLYAKGVGNQDPYFYITTTSQFDLLPFLNPKEAKNQLFSAGKMFLDWNGADKSQKIAAQLKKIDPAWGLSLAHEILYWKYDYVQATQLYESSEGLIDISHYRQFQITLKVRDWLRCETIINKIQSTSLQRLAKAMLLYEKEDWSTLALISPQSRHEQRWQLMARLKLNDSSALNHLASITEVKFDNLKQLNLLAESYERFNFTEQAALFKSQIAVITHARLNFYASQIQVSRIEKNSQWSTVLEKEFLELSGEKF